MSTAAHAAEEPQDARAGDPAGGTSGGGAGDTAPQPAPGVTIEPAVFQLVAYDAGDIVEIATSLSRRIGLPADLPIRIEVDETTPLGKARVASVEPVVLELESGALEDPLRPRRLSPRAAADVVGRLLFRLHDRRDPTFGDPPPEDQLTHARSTAWDVYAMGRLGRLGQEVQRPRWLYHFRLRHGFTDVADAVFARIWDSDRLTWSDIEELSDTAASSRGDVQPESRRPAPSRR